MNTGLGGRRRQPFVSTARNIGLQSLSQIVEGCVFITISNAQRVATIAGLRLARCWIGSARMGRAENGKEYGKNRFIPNSKQCIGSGLIQRAISAIFRRNCLRSDLWKKQTWVYPPERAQL